MEPIEIHAKEYRPMNTRESRLRYLEEALQPSGLVVLPWDGRELREDCIRRYGYDPLARGVTYFLADEHDRAA
jgi:hypothetical protein